MIPTCSETAASDADVPEESYQEPGSPLEDEQHEELVMYLERDQLVSDKLRRLPRAPLSPRTTASLWALGIFALVVGAMVIYTFLSQLGS